MGTGWLAKLVIAVWPLSPVWRGLQGPRPHPRFLVLGIQRAAAIFLLVLVDCMVPVRPVVSCRAMQHAVCTPGAPEDRNDSRMLEELCLRAEGAQGRRSSLASKRRPKPARKGDLSPAGVR